MDAILESWTDRREQPQFNWVPVPLQVNEWKHSRLIQRKSLHFKGEQKLQSFCITPAGRTWYSGSQVVKHSNVCVCVCA